MHAENCPGTSCNCSEEAFSMYRRYIQTIKTDLRNESSEEGCFLARELCCVLKTLQKEVLLSKLSASLKINFISVRKNMGQKQGLVMFGLNQYVALWILWDKEKTITTPGNQSEHISWLWTRKQLIGLMFEPTIVLKNPVMNMTDLEMYSVKKALQTLPFLHFQPNSQYFIPIFYLSKQGGESFTTLNVGTP